MTTCLGKNRPFGLLCVCLMDVCQFVYVHFSLLVLRVRCGI